MYQRLETIDALDPKRVVQEGYDRIAEEHLEWAQSTREEERARYTAVLLNALPAGAEVLDLGCGAGLPTTCELARRFRVTGVDISARQIELARQNVPQARFIQADITQLDFPPARFDAIVASIPSSTSRGRSNRSYSRTSFRGCALGVFWWRRWGRVR